MTREDAVVEAGVPIACEGDPGVARGGLQGEGQHRLDGRLLVPALVAWAVLTALLPHRPSTVLTIGLGCAAGSVVLLVARAAGARATQRSPPWVGSHGLRGAVALTLAITGFVATAAGAHLARDRSGPVVQLAAERAIAEVVAVVTTEPRIISRGDERQALVVVELRLHRVHARGETSRVSTPVVVMAAQGQGWEDLRWRSTVTGWGRLQQPAQPERAVAVLRPRGAPTTTKAPTSILVATDHVRDRFRGAVDPLPADARGLVPGLVIGDTSLTPPDLTEAMRATGMTHLSAVSGSNVALVLGAIYVLVAHLQLPRRWRTPVVLVGLVCFVLLCRPEPSVLRAGVMGTVGLLALSSARRRVSMPALAAAVILLLTLDPWLARSFGFALSTLATLGLVLWSRPWADAIATHLPRRARLIGDAISVPLAAQVACAPVIVLLQGSITTVAVLANVLAAPLVAPTTVLGVVAAVLSPVWLPLAHGVAWLAALPAWVIGQVARRCAELPWGTLDWVDGVLGAWLLAALTLLVLLTGTWWRALARRRPWSCWALLAAGLATLWPVQALDSWPPAGWTVVGCDVGQGDAFVVRSGPSSGLLVDTGPAPDEVRSCLRDLGITRLDAIVLTHFHADHVGGLQGTLRALPVDVVYVSPVREPEEMARATLRELDDADVATRVLVAGEVHEVGQARMEVLSPGPRPVAGGSPANNGSLVLDIDAGSTRTLFTGDIEPEAARPLRATIEGRDYDVLKVAHHGSAAQDGVLVAGTKAEVALIGVGADNTFGHPAPSALKLLHDAGMVVRRTDTDGDIAVVREQGALVLHRRGG